MGIRLFKRYKNRILLLLFSFCLGAMVSGLVVGGIIKGKYHNSPQGLLLPDNKRMNLVKELEKRNAEVQRIDTITSISYIMSNDTSETISYAESYKPTGGIVPNAKVALQIALPILVQVYGKQILNDMPVSITLTRKNNWLLAGHVKSTLGGSFIMVINKETGQVLYLNHEK